MKYKIGDGVEIYNWFELKCKYTLRSGYKGRIGIDCDGELFTSEMEDFSKKHGRVLIVENHCWPLGYYKMEGISFNWTEKMIKNLITSDPILSRFEILDL